MMLTFGNLLWYLLCASLTFSGLLPVNTTLYPSDANFLLVKVADADAMYDFLIGKGIIVRNRNRVKGCEGCLRLTIGTPQENEALLKSISEYEKSIVR